MRADSIRDYTELGPVKAIGVHAVDIHDFTQFTMPLLGMLKMIVTSASCMPMLQGTDGFDGPPHSRGMLILSPESDSGVRVHPPPPLEAPVIRKLSPRSGGTQQNNSCQHGGQSRKTPPLSLVLLAPPDEHAATTRVKAKTERNQERVMITPFPCDRFSRSYRGSPLSTTQNAAGGGLARCAVGTSLGVC